MQQFYKKCVDQSGCDSIQTNVMVDQLVEWLRISGEPINDGDNEDDNVINMGLDFVCVDALAALKAMHSHLIEKFLH